MKAEKELAYNFVLIRALTCFGILPAIKLIWRANSPVLPNAAGLNYWEKCALNLRVFDGA